MFKKLPIPTIIRLCMIFQLCKELLGQGINRVSSKEMGRKLGATAHTVRKDLNYLGEIGNTGSGYDVAYLKDKLSSVLGFERMRKACIVGLGRLGTALLDYERFVPGAFTIAAGFDASINRLETISTEIRVFPAYEITEVVQRLNIELAIIAVPARAAQNTADALVAGGIRGIVNFAPVIIEPAKPDVYVRNIDVLNEMRVLLSLITLEQQ